MVAEEFGLATTELLFSLKAWVVLFIEFPKITAPFRILDVFYWEKDIGMSKDLMSHFLLDGRALQLVAELKIHSVLIKHFYVVFLRRNTKRIENFCTLKYCIGSK